MFRTGKPWLEVYEAGKVEPETRIFEGSVYELFRRAVEEHRGKTVLSFYGTTVEFREELPKSTVGKLLRRVLAEEERRRTAVDQDGAGPA